jgi:hypothetical protein
MRAAMGASLFRILAFVILIAPLISHANADVPTASQLVGEWQVQTVTYTNLTTNETKNVFGDSQLQGGVVYAQAENGLVGNVLTIVGVQKPPASPSAITPQEAAALFGQLFASSEKVVLSPASPGATGVGATVTTKLSSNPALAGTANKTYSLSGDTLTITTSTGPPGAPYV